VPGGDLDAMPDAFAVREGDLAGTGGGHEFQCTAYGEEKTNTKKGAMEGLMEPRACAQNSSGERAAPALELI